MKKYLREMWLNFVDFITFCLSKIFVVPIKLLFPKKDRNDAQNSDLTHSSIFCSMSYNVVPTVYTVYSDTDTDPVSYAKDPERPRNITTHILE